MRAVGIPTFGGLEVLRVVDLPVREPGAGEVRIRVAAAAVNPTDLAVRGGLVADWFTPFTPPYVPGMDAAGTIESVGAGVDRLAVGDVVMTAVSARRPEGGAQIELLLAPAASVVPIPDGVTIEQASTLPMNGLTALEALDLLAIPAGGTLAITGGAGLVAAYAIVLAKERGLRVIADARPDEHALVRGYGADEVVDRGEGPDGTAAVVARIRALAPDGVDGLLDAAVLGPAVFGAIRDGGAYAAVLGFRGETERGITAHEVWVVDRLHDTAGLLQLRDLAAAGRIPLRVVGTYPLEQVAEAHRRMAAGGIRGRLVIRF